MTERRPLHLIEAGSEAGARTTVAGRLLGPFRRFFSTAAAGGVVLLLAAVIALAWANSPWASAYHHLWETPVTVGAPGFGLTMSLHEWVNDGLMTVFFVLVGLEVKREFLAGELASRRTAMLPIAAAIGGMLLPALIYVALNQRGPGAAGWAIPMATDIAFSLGILALLGDRAPRGLRVFLAALAIADDLGAVIVIALFYGASVDWSALGAEALVLLALLGLNRAGTRHPMAYAIGGLILWVLMLSSGVHAALAGVLLALCVPARNLISAPELIARTGSGLELFRSAGPPEHLGLSSGDHQAALLEIESAAEQAQSPLLRMERSLHLPVAFGVMPLFALANAGVSLGDGALRTIADPISLGIIAGLVIGKPVGIVLASAAVVRINAAELPSGVSWVKLSAAAALAGVGFTMSIFIAGLAFSDPSSLETAKRGIILASVLAGTLGFLLLRRERPVSA